MSRIRDWKSVLRTPTSSGHVTDDARTTRASVAKAVIEGEKNKIVQFKVRVSATHFLSLFQNKIFSLSTS